MRRTNWRLRSTLSLAISITLLAAGAADAQTWTGLSTTSNNWTDLSMPTNWDNSPGVPPNDGSAAIIYTGTAPRLTSTVDVNYNISTLTYNADAVSYTINQTGGSTLTLQSGITDSSGAIQSISVPLIIGGPNPQTWTINSGAQLNVNGTVTGNGQTFTKQGTGILRLNSTGNTGFGPITVAAGTMQAGTSNSLPDVDYTINGTGILDFNGTTNTINSAALSDTGLLTTGTGGVATITNALTINGTATVNVTGGTMTTGSLNGTSATANLNIGSGSFTDNTISPTDSFAGVVTLSNGGHFILAGAGGGNLTLTNTGNSSAGTPGGAVQINALNTLTAGADGSLPIADYIVDGTLNAQGHDFTVTSLTGGSNGAVTLGSATMTIANTTGTPTFSGTIGGATSGSKVPTIDMVSGSQTISGVIGGSGDTTKVVADGGTLTLTGNNTYTGGTTLNTGGTVAIIQDDATVHNLGDITKALTFNGGTLQINGNTHAVTPTQFNRPVVFQSGGAGIDVQVAGAKFTVSQNISGDHFNVNPNNGQGTVVITGNNTYGTTDITAGTLQVGNGTGTAGTLGTGAVTDNGNLVIDHATTGTGSVTISNNITGSGTMDITGGETVVLTGANALTGATTIDAGNTLKGAVGNIPGDVVANGTLDFTQATDATYSNSITGAATGAVIKDGAGTLTFSGTNNYASSTTVNAGRLDITGTTTSSAGITVAAKQTGSSTITGGTLGGTGTITGDIVNNGTVSPGVAITTPLGTLNQTGNYTGNSGSTFITTVNDANNSELITTGNVAVHTGSTVLFDINGPVQNGMRYVAIDTTGGTVTVDPGVTYKTDRFFVGVTESNSSTEVAGTINESFIPTSSGVTFNQRQIGTYLNANMSSTNTDFQAILTALGSISNGADALNALTQLTGDIHPTMAQVNVNNTQVVIGQVAARLRGANFAPGGPLAVAKDGSPIAAPVAFVGCDENGMPEFEAGEPGCRSQWSGWAIGFGMGGATEFSGNATSADFGTGGVVAGFEHWADDCHLFGIYGAYVGSGVTAENGQNATMNGGQFGGYAFGDDGFNYYTALGGFEFDGDTTTRRVAFGTGADALSDVTNANYGDWQAFAYAERGLSFQSCNHVLQPFLGVQYIFVRQNAFTESGATNTAINLSGSGDSTNSLRSMLGTRMQWAMTNHAGRRTLPEIHAMWVHEYLDTSSGLTATMVPVGGTPFIVQGLDMGRDWGVFGGNFTWEMVNGWSMFVNYDLQSNVRTTYSIGSGGVGYSW